MSRNMSLMNNAMSALELATGIAVILLDKAETADKQAAMRQASQLIMAGAYDLVIWKPEIFIAATNGYEAFWDAPCQMEMMHERPQLWLFDCETDEHLPAGKIPPNCPPETHQAQGIWVYPSYRKVGDDTYGSLGFMQFFWPRIADGKPEAPKVYTAWEPGIIYGFPLTENAAVIVAAQKFLQLPFVTNTTEEPNHQTRKQYKHQNRKIPPIRIVTLRRSESHSSSTSDNHIDYSCCFGVSSHWRKPNARMKEQRPVYVNSYLKGDTSKPFRARRTVFVANR